MNNVTILSSFDECIDISNALNRVVFVTCDVEYMKTYGYDMIRSCIKHGQNVLCGIAINSHDYSQRNFNPIANIDIGTGQCHFLMYYNDGEYLHDRGFFTNFRFLCLPSILHNYDEMLVLDIDGIVRKPIIWEEFNKSIGIRQRIQSSVSDPVAREGSNVLAGALYLRNDEIGQSYIRNVKQHIMKEGMAWFIDQVVLWRELQKLDESHFFQMNGKYVDYKFQDSSIVWTGKGKRKHDKKFQNEKRKYE